MNIFVLQNLRCLVKLAKTQKNCGGNSTYKRQHWSVLRKQLYTSPLSPFLPSSNSELHKEHRQGSKAYQSIECCHLKKTYTSHVGWNSAVLGKPRGWQIKCISVSRTTVPKLMTSLTLWQDTTSDKSRKIWLTIYASIIGFGAASRLIGAAAWHFYVAQKVKIIFCWLKVGLLILK